jgi:hypothetical protein
MRTLLVTAGLALGALVMTAGSASAQFGRYSRPNYGPGYRGNISPYLNLARGNNTGINYYLGTRAESQRRQNASEFADDIRDLQGRETQVITSGTAPQRNTLQRYFNNTGGYFAPIGPTR